MARTERERERERSSIKQPLLTVAITAHDENLWLYKTLRSIKNALRNFKISEYEVIIHVDNGSDFLLEHIDRADYWPLKFKNYKNHFGDLGQSRNFCAKKAKGKYLFFMDADDLVSENFLEKAVKILGKNKDILLHPESCLTFEEKGSCHVLMRTTPGETIEDDAFSMLEKNLWVSMVIGERDIFLKYPYMNTENGFGHEDYAFNMATLAAGIRHCSVPGEMEFYRIKKESLCKTSNGKHVTQPRTDLFGFEKWHGFSIAYQPPLSDKKMGVGVKQKALSIYKKARHNSKILNAAIEPFATAMKTITGKKLITSSGNSKLHPQELEHWKKISQIEMQLYPTENKIQELIFCDPRIGNRASMAYLGLCQEGIQEVDYVFVVPWVSTGGADKVLINYTKAFKELYPKKKIAVVTTLKAQNEWKDKLADNTIFVDFGNFAAKLNDFEKEILFTRLLIQLNSHKIHIINSSFAYEWVDTHRDLVKNNFELFASLFCYDVIPNTNGRGRASYIDPFASSIYDLIDAIYTDNSALVKPLAEEYGFESEKIIVQYQSNDYVVKEPNTKKNSEKLNVLWAGRICYQKNPETLLEIADVCDSSVNIDVYGKFEENYSEKTFVGHQANYISTFNGLDSIDVSKYDCFLLTSRIEGLPNILIEATAQGLPVIASNVGGVGDLIKDKETGILINSPFEIDEYVKALTFAKNHQKVMKKYCENAQKLLTSRHSWDTYLKTIKKTMNI